MNKIIRSSSSIDRRNILLNILFAITYNDVAKLRDTFEIINPSECAGALSFITAEQRYKVVVMLGGQIKQEILDLLDDDLRVELLEKIDEIVRVSDPVEIIGRDEIIQRTLGIATQAIAKKDSIKAIKLIESLQDSDAATLLEFLKPKQRYILIELLENHFRPEILTYLDPSVATQLLTKIDHKILSIYIADLDLQDKVEILQQMDLKHRNSVLNSLGKLISKEDLRFVKKNLQYKEGTAGRMMNTATIMSVNSTIQAAYRRYCFYAKTSDANQVIYVYDADMKVPGKIYLSDLCKLSQRRQTRLDLLSKHIQPVPFVVFVDTTISEIAFLVKKYYTIDMPVLTSRYKIVGSIASEQVISVFEMTEEKKMMTMGGVSDFDFHIGIMSTVRRRMGTLAFASFLCIISAFLIHSFEDIIQTLVPLAVVGPAIAGIGGNTASQVMTVTVRALSSGEIAGSNKIEAISKEVAVCLLCGLCVGMGLAFIFFLVWWSRLFCLIIFCCTTFNLFVAGLAGSGIPIILSSLKRDPALSSTIMNVITDVCGYGCFFIAAYCYRKPLTKELFSRSIENSRSIEKIHHEKTKPDQVL